MRVVPETYEIAFRIVRLSTRLSERHLRFAALVGSDGVAEITGHVEEIAELGERLPVADEELRAQPDQLAGSLAKLEALSADDKQLLAAAPAALLTTDSDGPLLDLNRAAAAVPPAAPFTGAVAAAEPAENDSASDDLDGADPVVSDLTTTSKLLVRSLPTTRPPSSSPALIPPWPCCAIVTGRRPRSALCRTGRPNCAPWS
jgi:hypothetical protein